MKRRILFTSIFVTFFSLLLIFCFGYSNNNPKNVNAEDDIIIENPIVFDTLFENSLFSNSTIPEGNYYLNEDIIINKTLDILENTTVNINLCGYSIVSTYNGIFINIYDGATLKIYDSGTNTRYFSNENNEFMEVEEGIYSTIGGYLSARASNAALFNNTGTLEMHDCAIIGGSCEYSYIINGSYDYAIGKPENNGNCSIYNTEFYFNNTDTLITNDGKMYISNCFFYDNISEYYLICNYSDLHIENSDIRMNTTNIFTTIMSEGSLLINGETVIVNNYTKDFYGGCVDIDEKGSLTLGGSVTIDENFYVDENENITLINVSLDSNCIYLEKDDNEDINISENLSIGISYKVKDSYPITCIEGEIFGESYGVNYSNFFHADDNNFIIVGVKDEETDTYSLFQKHTIIKNPTKNNPTFVVNSDDNMDVTYQWYKLYRDYDNYEYFDQDINGADGLTLNEEPGDYYIDNTYGNGSIVFNGKVETIISFNVEFSEETTQAYVHIYKNNYLNEIYYVSNIFQTSYSFKLPESAKYIIQIQAYDDDDYSNQIVHVTDLRKNELVVDYDDPVYEETNTLQDASILAGSYVCEVSINGHVYSSDILTFDSKIIKQPTTDDPSVEVGLSDEDDVLSYGWYYCSYTDIVKKIVDEEFSSNYENVDFLDNKAIRFYINSGVEIYVQESCKINLKSFINENISKECKPFIKIYKESNYSLIHEYSPLDDSESYFEITDPGYYYFAIYWDVEDEDLLDEENTYIDIMIATETGGYKKEFLLEEYDSMLLGEYPIGAYLCEIELTSGVLVSNVIDYGHLNFTYPTINNPTFIIDNENFTYQWYLFDGDIEDYIEVEGETSNILSDIDTKIGSYICIASYGDLKLKSESLRLFTRIIKQPTKENTSIVVICDGEADINYQWYRYNGEYDIETWNEPNMNYCIELENENESHLLGEYPYGVYFCYLSIDTEILASLPVNMGELNIKAPTQDDPTIVYNNEKGYKEEIEWYEYKEKEFDNYVITNKDIKILSDIVGYDSWCIGEYIENRWFFSKENMCSDIYDELSILMFTLPEGAVITITVESMEDCYFDVMICNWDNVDYLVSSETPKKSFTVSYKLTEDASEVYVSVIARNFDSSLYYDTYSTITISDFSCEMFCLLEDETTATLSNKESRFGWYTAVLRIGDCEETMYVNFSDRIIENPSIENEYTVKIISKDEEPTYEWYKYSSTMENLDDNSEKVTHIGDGGFINNHFVVKKINHPTSMEDFEAFTFTAQKGETLKFNIYTNGGTYIMYYIVNENDDVVSGDMLMQNQLVSNYTFLKDGTYIFACVSVANTNGFNEYKETYVEASIGIETYELVDGDTEKFEYNEGTENGYYLCIVSIYDGSTILESKPFLYCGHDYEINYTWNEDYTELTAVAKCKDCEDEITESATITVLKTKEGTCQETGHSLYTGIFTNSIFETQTHEEESSLGQHVYGDLIEGNNPTCIEKGTISHYYCSSCKKYFDENYLEVESILVDTINHNLTKVEGKDATCLESGNVEYYTCSTCNKNLDSEGLEIGNIILESSGHNLIMIEGKVSTTNESGNVEYYVCSKCGKVFKDSEGKIETSLEEVAIEKLIIKGKDGGCKSSINQSILFIFVPLVLVSCICYKRKRIY